MNKTLIALWITLTAAIVTLSVFAILWWNQRQLSSNQRLESAMQERLKPFQDQVAKVTDEYRIYFQRQLANLDASNDFGYGSSNLDKRLDPTAWMPMQRDPRIQQIVVLNKENRLVYPANLTRMNSEDQGFVIEAIAVMKQGAFRVTNPNTDDMRPSAPNRSLQQTDTQAPTQATSKAGSSVETAQPSQAMQSSFGNGALSNESESRKASGSGWTAWYFGRRMVIGFWSQYSDGTLVMLTVPRTRILSDFIAVLPSNTTGDEALAGSLVQIIDSDGKTLHQWGDLEIEGRVGDPDVAKTSLSLGSPMENLRLRLIADSAFQRKLAPTETIWPMLAAIASLSGVLMILGLQVTLALNRQLRLAKQQVSFVNQVSHELRTPLTNICMYADLAQSAIDSESDRAEDRDQRARLDVIQQESGRLNRLIDNVLQFARTGGSQADTRFQEHSVDGIVSHALSLFQPRLTEKGFEIVTEYGCRAPVRCDSDMIEQMVVNLISNAEKYAASGRFLEIVTSIEGEHVSIRVSDKGPGIPKRLKRKLFRPFVRASHELESPSGTGIGLSIVRQLARKHGGDCVLVDSEVGATFLCHVRVRSA
jgi:signal transduction histidine kinase